MAATADRIIARPGAVPVYFFTRAFVPVAQCLSYRRVSDINFAFSSYVVMLDFVYYACFRSYLENQKRHLYLVNGVVRLFSAYLYLFVEESLVPICLLWLVVVNCTLFFLGP